MPWLKAGDNAATHPVVMRGAAGGDQRQVNELFGFVTRCALHAAAHLTDYFVDEQVCWMFGGPETDRLTVAAKRAGYWRPARRDGHRGWQLVEDPEFLHIRMKAEVEWERQQRRDAANPQIIWPVRLRDGDACRYCGHVVQWKARRGNRRGTYDHNPPGAAATVDTLVVACGACNSARRDDPHADDRYPLRPPPDVPYYTASTAALLVEAGYQVTASSTAPPAPPAPLARPGSQPGTATRPGSQPDTATRPRSRRDTASTTAAPPAPLARPGSQPDTATRPRSQRDTASSDPAASGTPLPRSASEQCSSADSVPKKSRSVGSGRDRDGAGRPRAGPGRAVVPGPERVRGRRGRPRSRGDG